MKIAFYAPLKAPDDPTPSGDRAMARLLVKALERAGHGVSIGSTLRSFSKGADAMWLATLQRQAAAEIDRLLSHEPRPDLFLTYHPYYKAPDLVGPSVATQLGIPYVTVEASHAPKRKEDDWRPWQAEVERALDAAALNICMTARDHAGLAAYLGSKARLAMLPPFLDAPDAPATVRERDDVIELVTVAMMRLGDKLQSYRFLAEALRPLLGEPWRLTIMGDGPARAEVEAAFAGFPEDRCIFLGEVAGEAVPASLAKADLYLWPGFGEAYGLAYLEAQAQSLPVVALDCGGISSVVEHGRTGVLVPVAPVAEETLAGYRFAVMSLLSDESRRRAMGEAARNFVRNERSLAGAATRLDALLGGVISRHALAMPAHG